MMHRSVLVIESELDSRLGGIGVALALVGRVSIEAPMESGPYNTIDISMCLYRQYPWYTGGYRVHVSVESYDMV